ncbi:Uncharacterised protein [Klebsiella pneumoniae]|nr:Uncharacterised protein [Klebsiella pneumoniae]
MASVSFPPLHECNVLKIGRMLLQCLYQVLEHLHIYVNQLSGRWLFLIGGEDEMGNGGECR